jgi:FAD-dependent oxidoreductase domain-containing protein 1
VSAAHRCDDRGMHSSSHGVRVVIVGGAVTGSAIACFLASHPRFAGSVLVLEADPSYAACATTRSVASIRHQFSTPTNIAMSIFGTRFIRQAH